MTFEWNECDLFLKRENLFFDVQLLKFSSGYCSYDMVIKNSKIVFQFHQKLKKSKG